MKKILLITSIFALFFFNYTTIIAENSNEKSKFLDYDLVYIKNDSFILGDVFKQGNDNELPTYEISIDSLYFGKTLITNDQYQKYLKEIQKEIPTNFDKSKLNHPVVNITFKEAALFCNFLSKKDNLEPVFNEKFIPDFTKSGYRMPTNAEFEYVASSSYKGNKTFFHFGNNIPDEKIANFNETIFDTTFVTKYPPSDIGIYDLLGNVWEFTSSNFYQYEDKLTNFELSDIYVNSVILKGGSFRNKWFLLRASELIFIQKDVNFNDVGFRIVKRAN